MCSPLNSLNSVTKVFVITVKGFEPAISCVRDQDAATTPARHVRDRIFKLTLIHASVIYQIPWICRNYWIFVSFRENPSVFSFFETRFMIRKIQVIGLRHNIYGSRRDIAPVMKVYWCFPLAQVFLCVLLHLSVSLLLDYQKRKGHPGPKIDKTDEFFIDSHCLSGGGCAVCLWRAAGSDFQHVNMLMSVWCIQSRGVFGHLSSVPLSFRLCRSICSTLSVCSSVCSNPVCPSACSTVFVCLSVRPCLFLCLCVSPSICVWIQFVPRNKHIFCHISGMRNPFDSDLVFAFTFAQFKRTRNGNHKKVLWCGFGNFGHFSRLPRGRSV